MNLVKTFDTSGMNSFLFDIFVNSGCFVEDGVGIYRVGDYVSEYELAHEDDKKRYDLEDIEKMRKFDNYLISNGAEKGDQVFIYHGTYNKTWMRIS